MRALVIMGAVVCAASAVIAQDAVRTLPDIYKIEFENEYVRVTRVQYPAHAKLPGHTHPSLAAAYVYLNDAGPVAFKHIGLEYGAVTRPPTVARSFRLFRGLEEVHEVENLSDTPSHFLRVEFKTDPGPDPRTLRGKFLPARDGATAGSKVEFENAQVRISRVFAGAGGQSTKPSSQPSLVVLLTDAELGKTRWLAAEEPMSGSAFGAAGEALWFEFKTPPRGSKQN